MLTADNEARCQLCGESLEKRSELMVSIVYEPCKKCNPEGSIIVMRKKKVSSEQAACQFQPTDENCQVACDSGTCRGGEGLCVSEKKGEPVFAGVVEKNFSGIL